MKRIFTLLLILTMGIAGCRQMPPLSDNSSIDSVTSTVTESIYEKNSLPSPIPEAEPEPVPQNFNITMTFLGDMILANQRDIKPDGRFEEFFSKNPPEYFLSKVNHILSADDFTIANLENVMSDKQLTPVEKNYSPAFWFKSKTANLNVLTKGSVEAVLLTNNHIMDYGYEGYKDTVDAVSNAGLKYGTDNNIIELEKNGFKIAVICTGLWGEYNVTNTLRRLETAKADSDFQVVFFHGGTEKLHTPEEEKVNAARKFVDNGADLVVGGHPHVLQPREIYNGVEIVYSVGNFCYGGAFRPENRTIIYQYTLTVNPDGLTVQNKASNIIPCYVYTRSINNYQPAIIEDAAHKQQVLDFMNGKIDSPI
ncbi:MAG: CapA family protein [Clostridia bacterium]|nr:CapA family protein [Clostridia bacterium]